MAARLKEVRAAVPHPSTADQVIDLDAMKAARLEATGPKQVRFGGRDWLFKPELPMQVVDDFAGGDIQAAFSRLLVVSEMADEFLASGDLTQPDFAELLKGVYGLDLPDASV